MSSLYPNYIDNFIDKRDETGDGNGDYVLAEHVNHIQDAITAIQNALGTNPQGNAINLVSRLYGLEQTQSLSVPRVTLYNGNPIHINGATDAESAARSFSYFDQVIFTNIDIYTSDILDARDVIEKTKSVSNTKFYAQIDAGVATSGYSIEDINLIMSKWIEVGIDGIYFNNFGYNAGTSRERQNALISLAHDNGLYVIVNATNYDDVFNRTNVMGMNPDNVETELESDDAFLYIGFAVNGLTYQSLDSIASMQSLLDYRTKYGTKIFVLATIDETDAIEAHKKYYYGQALAILYSLDSFHAVHSVSTETTDIYATLPIVGSYYDAKPIIKRTGSLLARNSKVGKITIDIANHTYSFDNIKIPLRFIDFDADDTKIDGSKIDGLMADVVAEINNYSGVLKINPDRIEFNTISAAEEIVKSINLISSQISPKIDPDAISDLSAQHIHNVVVQALEQNLGTLLENGTYDANLQNMTARWISSLNAYFNNVIVGNAEIEGLDAGVINAGQINVKILGTNTITSDKLSIHANGGVNKWAGTIVLKENSIGVTNLSPAMILGKDAYRKVELVDSEKISTSNAIGTALDDYIVMWETHVFCTSDFSQSKTFTANSNASLFVNGLRIANIIYGQNVIYTLNLVPGWNHIQVIQDHSKVLNTAQPIETRNLCEFNIGIKLSSYSLFAERGEPSSISRVDAYADNVTQIIGDRIKTGTIEAKHINVEDVKAGLVEAGIIRAMEAYIETITSTEGNFERILSNMLKADVMDANHIRITSEAQDRDPITGLLSGNSGVLMIDNGGMIVSSKPRIENEVVGEKLTLTDTATYSSVNTDWVIDMLNFPVVSLKHKTDVNAPELTVSDANKAIKFKEGKVVLTTPPYVFTYNNGTETITSNELNIADYDMYVDYKYYSPVWPADARLIKLDRLGLWISENGGQQWQSKITGAGLRITGSAEIAEAVITNAHITDLEATKIEAGELDLEKGITIASDGGYVSFDGTGLIIKDNLDNPMNMIRISRNGIEITQDGGNEWISKLTAEGLVVDSADIGNVSADDIVSGTIQADTTIQVGDSVTINGTSGITVDGAGIGIEVKDGKVQVTDGVAPRVVLGNYDGINYGLQVLTTGTPITLNKDGLSAAKFSINADGTITATDGIFSGSVKADSGWFGDAINHIDVDSTGLVLGTGSIVDVRGAGQKLKIDASGIVAQAGKIGNLDITAEGLRSALLYDINPDTISLVGDEALTINTGTMVVKDGGKTYISLGKLGASYGMKINLYNAGIATGEYIQLDQDGLRTSNGSIDIDRNGNLSISGEINATSGKLETLTVEGTVTVTGANGKIVAGNTELTSTGITANQGSIAGWTVDADKISKGSVSIDSSTEKIQTTGVTIGQYQAGVYGIEATRGKIGGWNLADNTLSSGTMTIDAGAEKITTTGVILGKYDVDTYGLKATAGIIGGWNLTADKLYTTNMHIDAANELITVGNDQVLIGKYTGTTYGLKAGNVILNANGIVAPQGTIGGWTLAAGEITSGNIHLDRTNNAIWIGSTLANANLRLNNDGTAKMGIVEINKVIDTTTYSLHTPNFSIDAAGNVTMTGNVVANSGSFKGTINATSGWFGADAANSVQISGSGITAGAVNINKLGVTVATTGGSLSIKESGLTIVEGPDGTSQINLNNKFTANATGGITATLGNIAGWTINDTQIKSPGDVIVLDSALKKISIGQYVDLLETGFIARTDANNYLKIDNTGLRIIKNGSDIGAAITKDGIYGALITDQTIPGSAFDKVAPGQVQNVVTDDFIEQIATGEFANIAVTWDAVADTDNDLAGYIVYLKENEIGKSYYPVARTSDVAYTIRNIKSNMSYKVKVAAYDLTGNEGVASAESICMVAPDGMPPSQVQNVRVTDGLLSFALRWNVVNDVDVDFYEVQRSESADLGSTWTVWHTIAKVYTDLIIDKELSYDVTYKYRVAAVDLSKNGGSYEEAKPEEQRNPNWSAVYTAGKPSRIGKNDIVAGTITAEELNIGSVVKSINSQVTSLFHFDGTLMSTQGLTPYVDIVGQTKIPHQMGFFKKDAKFGASLSIEEKTENIISVLTSNNATLKDNTGGWHIGTAQYVAGNGVDGIDDGYIEVPYDTTNYIEHVPVEAGKTYTLSIYAKSVSLGSIARVDIQREDGTAWQAEVTPGTLRQVIDTPTTLDWKRYIVTFTVPVGSNTTKIKLVFMQSIAGSLVAIDNIQLEQRAYATSFVNGSKDSGYVDYYAPSIMLRDSGTMAFWMKSIIGWHETVSNDHAESPYHDNIFVWGKPTDINDVEDNAMYAKYDRMTKTISVKYNGQWLEHTFTEENEPSTSWIHFALTWKTDRQRLYINGIQVAENTAPTMSVDPGDSLFRLGYMPRIENGEIVEEFEESVVPRNSRASCLFDEFRVDKEIIDEEELKSWFLQQSSFYDASAQIDADSQNISAANASVSINNEGVTIRDGKLHVISGDGQTLITGGRLMVNGLDVGIAQSDNGVYNGNFTIGDTLYGPGDVRQSQKGIESWGAKYWRSRRSSTTTDYYVRNSLSWNRIWFAQYVGENAVKSAYEEMIRPQVTAGFQKTMRTWVSETIHAEIMKINPAIAGADLTTCKNAGMNAIDSYINNTSFNTITYIGTQLAGLPAYTNLVIAIVEGFKSKAVLTPEYNVGAQVKANAPGTPQPIIEICKTAGRNAFNSFLADYDADTNLLILVELSSTLPAAGVVDPVMIGGLVAITQQTIVGMQVPTKQSQETLITDSVTNSFGMLNDWNTGYVTWNDINGTRQFKVLHIMYPEEVADYTMWHPETTWVAGALYEVTSPIVKDLIFGWPGTINIAENIDFVTGLPMISTTPFEIGGTEYFVDVFGSYLGRVGFAELGVMGPNAEQNIVEQDTSKLIVYADGFKPSGTHFKQHTISFNAVWKKDKFGDIIKADSSKLYFDVEELVPKYTINGDGTANVIPSYVYNMMPSEAVYNTSPTVAYWRAILGETIFGNPFIVTLEDKMIMHGSVMMPDNITPLQAIEIGNKRYPNSSPSSYQITCIKNMSTIMAWIQSGGTNGLSYTHPLYGKTGKIYNKVCYFEIPDAATQQEIDEIIARDTPQVVLSNVIGVDNPDPDGNETVLKVSKKGDFATIYFASYSEADAIATVYQHPDGSTYDTYVDGKWNSAGRLQNSSAIFQNIELGGIQAGPHFITFATRASRNGVDDIEGDNVDISMGQIRIFDWYNIKNVIPQIPDVIVPMIDKLAILEKIESDNTVEFISEDSGVWTRMSIEPKLVNSKTSSGTPVFPEGLPCKYKVRVRLEKDDSDDLPTTVRVTGVQAELGTNPSYVRTVYGENSIPGSWIQSYNKELWLQSGIKTRHFEEHVPNSQNETGVYGRHIADGTVTSTKIAFSAINDTHISDANVTFRKTRIRKSKLTTQVICADDYESEYGDEDLFDKYVCFLPTTPSAGSYYLPMAIEYTSEDIFENGQLLVPGDDYSIHKRIGLIRADDMWEVARILGNTSSNPVLQAIKNETASRELSLSEIQSLGIELLSVDAYTTAIGEQLKRDDVQIEYATQIVFSTPPDVTDTYVMKYWQEI